MNKIKRFIVKEFLAAVLVIVCFCAAWIVAAEDEIEATNNAMYCEMVNLHKQSQGQLGWPAYEGTSQCN